LQWTDRLGPAAGHRHFGENRTFSGLLEIPRRSANVCLGHSRPIWSSRPSPRVRFALIATIFCSAKA
jgi:hypothetical protein